RGQKAVQLLSELLLTLDAEKADAPYPRPYRRPGGQQPSRGDGYRRYAPRPRSIRGRACTGSRPQMQSPRIPTRIAAMPRRSLGHKSTEPPRPHPGSTTSPFGYCLWSSSFLCSPFPLYFPTQSSSVCLPSLRCVTLSERSNPPADLSHLTPIDTRMRW